MNPAPVSRWGTDPYRTHTRSLFVRLRCLLARSVHSWRAFHFPVMRGVVS